MAYTLDQYNSLVEAISQGATRVKYADKEVQYNSFDQMLRLKRMMEADLGLISGKMGTKFAKFSKGLNGSCLPDCSDENIII